MLKQIEGSRAIGEAVALCRPEVICAYPIMPQTHIVEGLGEMVKDGRLDHCEFINVESDFAALSVAIGASAAGARAYTATASQGLLLMAEAVYNASGLGLPIVMTLVNSGNWRAGQCVERSLRRDVHARCRVGSALRGDEPGSRRSAHSGVQARRGAFHAGHGLRRRLQPYACGRARRYCRSGCGRRFSSALRSRAGARSR